MLKFLPNARFQAQLSSGDKVTFDGRCITSTLTVNGWPALKFEEVVQVVAELALNGYHIQMHELYERLGMGEHLIEFSVIGFGEKEKEYTAIGFDIRQSCVYATTPQRNAELIKALECSSVCNKTELTLLEDKSHILGEHEYIEKKYRAQIGGAEFHLSTAGLLGYFAAYTDYLGDATEETPSAVGEMIYNLLVSAGYKIVMRKWVEGGINIDFVCYLPETESYDDILPASNVETEVTYSVSCNIFAASFVQFIKKHVKLI